LRKHENDILVEDVADKKGVSTIGFSAMGEQQVLEEFELSDSVVS
jgi:hypothetical protein